MTTPRRGGSYVSRLKQLVPSDSALRRGVRRYRLWRSTRHLAGPRLLRAFAGAYPEAFFVQIGSNDGEQLDPLRTTLLRSRFRGVMVEPVPHVFARLERNTSAYGDRIKLANVAVGTEDAVLPFYHLAPATESDKVRLPFWYDQLGSFRKEVVLEHADVIPDIEQRLVEISVPSVTFATLFRRFGVGEVNLLHTDAEGFDYALLREFDFNRYQPRLVIYEHFHLSEDEKRACLTLMAEHGYESIEEGMDTWNLRVRGVGKRDLRLLREWRRRVDKPTLA